MTTRTKIPAPAGVHATKAPSGKPAHKPSAEKQTVSSVAKPEGSLEMFSRLIRSIDSNLSVAHQFAGAAKKRLG